MIFYYFITFSTKYQVVLRYKYKCGEKNLNNEILILPLSQRISVFVLTYFVESGIISSVLRVPVEHHTRWRLLPLSEGSIFLLPSLQGREVDNMEYITLTQLLMIISIFIAFADLLFKYFNDRK